MRPGKKFLHSLFEIAHVEFQTYDLYNHRLLFSSGVLHQLLGYSAEEYAAMSGDFYKTLVYPDDYPTVERAISEISCAKKGDVVEMTARMIRRDGSIIWVHSRQMIFEHNAKTHVCSIMREVEDVTKLVELQNELEQKVAQLQAISYKNSHLLRSPVASILGLVDLIEEEGIHGEHNLQILQFLKEAISRLDEVIHEINEVGREKS